MKPREIRGLIEDETGRRAFILRISGPQKTADGDYFCVIDLPAVAIVGEGVKIFGINAKQAVELSLDFVRKTLSTKKLFHENGRPMKI